MTASVRNYLSPITAVVTLAIGIGFVAVISAGSSVSPTPVAVAWEAPAETNDTYDFYSVPRVETLPATPTEFSCYDPHILPIWHELKKDYEFTEWIGDNAGSLNCSELLEIKGVDLNRDGKKEFLVRGKLHLCGATGNCGFWVFELKGSRARKILSSTDYVEDTVFGNQVQNSRTRGYSNILLRGHFTAAETSFSTYTFNGKRYVESRCMFEVLKYDRKGEGSMEMISCTEFDRRLQSELANTKHE